MIVHPGTEAVGNVVCGVGDGFRTSHEHIALYASPRSGFEGLDGAIDGRTNDFGRIRGE